MRRPPAGGRSGRQGSAGEDCQEKAGQERAGQESGPVQDALSAYLAPLEAPEPPADRQGAVAPETFDQAPRSGATFLSPQDRHRMEAILAELNECARTLSEARRR